MTRAEHMAWCKARALAYLPASPQEAVTSMLSDLGKHDETKNVAQGPIFMIGMHAAMSDSPDDARRFIEGFA